MQSKARGYDPAAEPTFEDRAEGTYERGAAVPAMTESQQARSWVEEAGIEELAAFAVKPKAKPDVVPAEPEEAVEPQGNAVSEAPDDGPPKDWLRVINPNAVCNFAPAYDSWPEECEVEILGPCPNRFLVRVRVVGGDGLPERGYCSMWKQGRSWTEGSKVKARIESPTGTIVYEPAE